MFNRTTRYAALVLVGVLPSMSVIADDPIVPNQIINTMLCPGEGDYCYWPELAEMPSALDRMIWDGSFTVQESSADGPGGRWLGHAASMRYPLFSPSVSTERHAGSAKSSLEPAWPSHRPPGPSALDP